MRHFVIAIPDHTESLAAARRTIETGAIHGLTIEVWPACTPDTPTDLSLDAFEDKWSRGERARACFMSHSALWELSVKEQIPVTIFEHDAVIERPIDDPLAFHKVINLGAPSYGNFNTPRFIGVGPLSSCAYFKGAHAYRVNPHGAADLLQRARIHARATDLFLNIDNFPWLEECYPYAARSDDTFTTVQHPAGTKAKHAYGPDYKTL